MASERDARREASPCGDAGASGRVCFGVTGRVWAGESKVASFPSVPFREISCGDHAVTLGSHRHYAKKEGSGAYNPRYKTSP